jgi:hypothetical protein
MCAEQLCLEGKPFCLRGFTGALRQIIPQEVVKSTLGRVIVVERIGPRSPENAFPMTFLDCQVYDGCFLAIKYIFDRQGQGFVRVLRAGQVPFLRVHGLEDAPNHNQSLCISV